MKTARIRTGVTLLIAILIGLSGWVAGRQNMAHAQAQPVQPNRRAAAGRAPAGSDSIGGFHVRSYAPRWDLKKADRGGRILVQGDSESEAMIDNLSAAEFQALLTLLHDEPGVHYNEETKTLGVGEPNQALSLKFPRTGEK